MPGENHRHETAVEFKIKILGRTLEHLGVQMYKRRDAAIAELVANCWDAGSTEVSITVPEPSTYDRSTDSIVIEDSGCGMSKKQVEADYLVVGRNRRASGDTNMGRYVMGRKGIGKLAGFGIANAMAVTTWKEGTETSFELKISTLKSSDDSFQEVPIPGKIRDVEGDKPSGTRITLSDLKHGTALLPESLSNSLARRFSRHIRGEMRIFVNESEIGEPEVEIEYRFPTGSGSEEFVLPNGSKGQFHYIFSKKVIPNREMCGFAIYARGKVAQAPPFFFGVEQQASGQHGTRYVTGVIEADFLDSGIDDDSDRISTDRQEIDWESDDMSEFKAWGQEHCRKILREWADRRGQDLADKVLAIPEIAERVSNLDQHFAGRFRTLVKSLGKNEDEMGRLVMLSDSLLKAFEYRHFHDSLDQIEALAEDPDRLHDLLVVLDEWKVLESRAILEVISGRLKILDGFEQMIVDNSPETAPRIGANNLHDYLARFPWILNPEWQIFTEEKRISTQLRDWHMQESKSNEEKERYDFLAYSSDSSIVIIEIKRSGHPLELRDIHKLESYQDKLSKAHKNIQMVLICGTVGINDKAKAYWEDRSDGEIILWSEVTSKTRSKYGHYKAILTADVTHQDFAEKEREVAATRHVLEAGSAYRTKTERREGIGPQDVKYAQRKEENEPGESEM